MPIFDELKKVLVLGSGPIEIGQAAEFDYAGTQACQALKEEGIEVVLLNSNPATIMTDPQIADRVYIEPLTCEVIAKIIQRENPQGILATTGGQTGLNLAMELEKTGILEKTNIPILGTDVAAIKLAEDRSEFRRIMKELAQPVPKSCIVEKLAEADAFVEEVGLPVVVRPAYTLGGTGGGLVSTMEELQNSVVTGLRQSPIRQVLLEQSIAGLREVEYEVIRDHLGKSVIVCDMENIDPVGVHTGDSVVVAPCQTLTAQEKESLETAAITIVNALGVVGSCNVQLALDDDGCYYVIEVNPRVSRSSALASKATGYPIARVASKISLGFSLQELKADQRPAVDYVVTKIPRWPFDKFPTANRRIGTQMKATGEVMAIGATLGESLQKAVRSLELDWDSLFSFPSSISQPILEERLRNPDDQRLFLLVEYLNRGYSVAELNHLTSIHPFFLDVIEEIVDTHQELVSQADLTEDLLLKAKKLGFSDSTIGACFDVSHTIIRDLRVTKGIRPSYCRVEAGALPYYYSSYNKESQLIQTAQDKRAIVVLGAGPIRIGQGIEFDYSTVHAAWAIANKGYQSIVINNNPETVSTDSYTSDRLYFEPLTEEDVWEVIQVENPQGILVQFGGQTAINLVNFLDSESLKIMGTSAKDIAGMEDRQRFDAAMEELKIPRPAGQTAASMEEAVGLASQLTYPVVVRPSYVLGGRGMEVVNSEQELQDYLAAFTGTKGYPLLIDNYLPGIEIEVDAISDGDNVFVPGIMEHLERAGVHSGDSIAIFPSQSISADMKARIFAYTEQIARHFRVQGFINIQFVISEGDLFVLEVNPRSSRTVPFLSKATGISLAQLATYVALGMKLVNLGYLGLSQVSSDVVAVKVPVFSFAKLKGMEVTLGPEMKSTGEVMGRGKNVEKALYKGFIAAKIWMPTQGRVLITVADKDKQEVIGLALALARLGMEIVATRGTAAVLLDHGIRPQVVPKLNEASDILDIVKRGSVDMVINTFTKGKQPQRDGFQIRSAAVENGVLCFTSLDTAKAYLSVVEDREIWLEPLLS